MLRWILVLVLVGLLTYLASLNYAALGTHLHGMQAADHRRKNAIALLAVSADLIGLVLLSPSRLKRRDWPAGPP